MCDVIWTQCVHTEDGRAAEAGTPLTTHYLTASFTARRSHFIFTTLMSAHYDLAFFHFLSVDFINTSLYNAFVVRQFTQKKTTKNIYSIFIRGHDFKFHLLPIQVHISESRMTWHTNGQCIILILTRKKTFH